MCAKNFQINLKNTLNKPSFYHKCENIYEKRNEIHEELQAYELTLSFSLSLLSSSPYWVDCQVCTAFLHRKKKSHTIFYFIHHFLVT